MMDKIGWKNASYRGMMDKISWKNASYRGMMDKIGWKNASVKQPAGAFTESTGGN
jgi:hypothetical protein